MPYSGSIFLTTVYPTDTTGVHGNNGGKSAGKHLFPSGKGRKCLKSSGNRYSGFLWDQDGAGSIPVTSTNRQCLHPEWVWLLLVLCHTNKTSETRRPEVFHVPSLGTANHLSGCPTGLLASRNIIRTQRKEFHTADEPHRRRYRN